MKLMIIRPQIYEVFTPLVIYLWVIPFVLGNLPEKTMNECPEFQPPQPVAQASSALVVYDVTKVSPLHLEKREFTFGEHTVTIKQDWSGVGLAAVVWDAAVVLGEYLQKNPKLVQKKKVIELGAGTGLTGILAALLGGEVTVTDRQMAIEALKENVDRNVKGKNCSIQAKELDWGTDLQNYTHTYDLILGADVIYIEETFQQLLQTLQHLSSCESLVLISCKIRYDRDTRFLELLKTLFSVKKIHYDQQRDINIYSARKLC